MYKKSMLACADGGRMRALVALGLLGLSACNSGNAPSAATELDNTTWRINSLRGELNQLKDRVYLAPGAFNNTAWLTPTEDTFGFLNTEIGSLALSVEGVKPLGDGSEVYIRFGNPTGATIEKLTFHAQWGPVDKEGNLIEAEAREGDKSIDKPLQPGSWNGTKVTFAGTPPEKLGRIIVSKPRVVNISLSGS